MNDDLYIHRKIVFFYSLFYLLLLYLHLLKEDIQQLEDGLLDMHQEVVLFFQKRKSAKLAKKVAKVLYIQYVSK